MSSSRAKGLIKYLTKQILPKKREVKEVVTTNLCVIKDKKNTTDIISKL
jgi:hypothetical protein